MGNTVTFVVRDDFLHKLPSYEWNSLEEGIHDPSYSIRFIETSANDVDPIGNYANGISISHYEHTTGKSVLYIDSNMLFSAPLLYGLSAEDLSEENIYQNSRRLSKFMFGPENAFNVSKSKDFQMPHNVVSESLPSNNESTPKSFVFRYKTDDCHSISEDKDLLKNLSIYIETGDQKYLSPYFEHVTTLSKNESILFSMHCPIPQNGGAAPFLKFDAPLVKPDIVNRLRIGVEKGVSANKIIASQAIIEGMGFEINSSKKINRDLEVTL